MIKWCGFFGTPILSQAARLVLKIRDLHLKNMTILMRKPTSNCRFLGDRLVDSVLPFPFGNPRLILVHGLSFMLKVLGASWCSVPVCVPRQVIGVIKTTKTDFEEDQQETSPEFPMSCSTYHSIQQRWEWIQPFLALRKLSAM